MRVFLLAIVCLAACGDASNLAPCNIGLYTGASSPDDQDCGSYSRSDSNYTDEAMVAAQLCVLNAIKANRGFHLAYDANSSTGMLDPTLRAGFTATNTNGVVTFRSYAGRTIGSDMTSSDDFVSSRDCDAIVATPNCKPIVGLPCLDCTGVEIGAVACRG